MNDRSKRTGRFIAGRKHKKKTLTRAKEAELYLHMAEKYLAMSFLVMPKMWTNRRRNAATTMLNAVRHHAERRVRKDRYGDIIDREGCETDYKRRLRSLNLPTDRDSIYREIRIHRKRRRK